MRAGIEPAIDDTVGIVIERAAKAPPAFARRLRAGWPLVGFLALGRRKRGIVRRLGRLLTPRQPCFQFADPSPRRLQPADQRQQRQDQRVLLGNRQLGKVDLGRHPDVDRVARDRVNQFMRQAGRGAPKRRGLPKSAITFGRRITHKRASGLKNPNSSQSPNNLFFF